MCEPMTAIAATAAVGGAATNIIGQTEQRNRAKRYETDLAMSTHEQILETRQMAYDAYRGKVYQEQLAISQAQQATGEASHDKAVERMKAEGAAKVAMAEGGVAGMSVNQLYEEYQRQEARYNENAGLSLYFKEQAATNNMKAYGIEYEQRSKSIRPYKPKELAPVDYFGPILGAVKSTGQAAMAGGVGK